MVAAAPPKRPSNTTGTRKVNALLEKLNKPGDSGSSAAAPAESNLPQRLTAASLRTTLKRNRSKFAACGNKIQGSSGSVRVSTSFVIQGSSGRVKSARIVNGGGTSAQVQRCVVSALKNTTFGRFKEATMTVNYPIQLL
ncbi:MAG: hypothetical protein CSA66_06285 [Proteobacteria bacterium]|nr:MAG: hypothetical protein CSA66_06285 [Pseudomonadota bacterium]